MNFPEVFIQWISLCITTASFSVQFNGELAGFFRSSRGLRQGCSLSPYLSGYHPKCKNLDLNHLSFADDIMVLTDGKVRSVEGIVRISGLKISMEKSTMYIAGVSESVRTELNNKFHFEMVSYQCVIWVYHC
ncbi:uncharacterized protein LOC112082025 [Eutrema salsugineum]|uniref:uncharacterized protein LOC112082025 n=1 Tax=Eutrema salsugineum TaxID=72664 RepID=UPI000CED5372|nr:uncharacterized protein LOC112082025 [Eutrema salsugineum]